MTQYEYKSNLDEIKEDLKKQSLKTKNHIIDHALPPFTQAAVKNALAESDENPKRPPLRPAIMTVGMLAVACLFLWMVFKIVEMNFGFHQAELNETPFVQLQFAENYHEGESFESINNGGVTPIELNESNSKD